MAPVTVPIAVWIRRAQLRWLGHLVRREDDYPPKCILFAHYMQPVGRRTRGRPPSTQQQNLECLIRELDRPGGVIRRVVDCATQFGVKFQDLSSGDLIVGGGRRVNWAQLAMNRVLWSRVVELGAMLGHT